MNAADFRRRYEIEKPFLRSWGQFVTDHVCTELSTQLGSHTALSTFLKVPPSPRIKDDESLVGKAYWRGLGWDNPGDPYSEITDKVGTRFVVLLLQDVERVRQTVVASPHWTAHKSRDFEQEAEENPATFSYQSIHFIVRANISLPYEGIIIPPETPCEVQIRTLLQHAYSEMSHDNVYKSLLKSSVDVHRAMARCVALIDSTDQMFRDTSVKIEEAKAGFEQKMSNYDELYRDTVHLEARRDDRTSAYLLEELSSVLANISLEQVRKFVQDHPGIGDRIRDRVSTNFLYTQSLILLLLYAVTHHPATIHDRWPYLDEHLKSIFYDVGMAYSY